MRREQSQVFKDWFDSYVKSFYSNEAELQAGIRLKEKHTARVCENIVYIGRSLNLKAEDLYLAEVIALFHDIGRFRQYTYYRTFNDRRSENHAILGLRELESAGVLSALMEKEQDLIMRAIEYHNMFELPHALESRCQLFTHLIRDADKLDILGVFTEYYTLRNREPNPVLESGLADTAGYSSILIKNLLQQRGCSYKDVKNYNDRKLLLLSWIYDINYSYTLSEIARNNYVKKIIDLLPGTEEIQTVHGHLQAYMTSRLTAT